MLAKAHSICHLTSCGPSGFLLSVLKRVRYSYLRLFKARLVGVGMPLVWWVASGIAHGLGNPAD
jgi:hypothetical protein